MSRRSIVISSVLAMVLSAATLFFLLNLTNPTSGGPACILLVLVLIYVFSLGLFTSVALLGDYAYHLLVPRKQDTTLQERLKLYYRKLVVVCSVLAFIPILIVALNSIGQLGFVDVTLIAALEIVAIFYVLHKM